MKVLVDTSVWIDHFRSHSEPLSRLLIDNLAATHTFVILELACGNLGKNASQVLSDINLLERSQQSSEEEFLDFIKSEKLAAHGLSLVDVELLWSALSSNVKLWTRDKKLNSFCKKYGCAFVA